MAARVAGALGWALLDNAIIDAVAQRLGVPPAEVEAREERVPSIVERLASTLALASPELASVTTEASLPPSEERLIAVTERVITEAVAGGDCVLVGRGAQSMLAERGDVIHVFCHAPRRALVTRVMEQRGVDEKQAERLVDDTNRAREQFVRRHWKRSWSAHENYHLCLNTDRLGVDGSADMIIRLARERFGLAR